MTAAYVEPSAINWLVDSQREPGCVARTLSSAGYRPVVGLHVIYELARTFLNPDRQARGQALFAFLRDLEPSVSPGSSNLMASTSPTRRVHAAMLSPRKGRYSEIFRSSLQQLKAKSPDLVKKINEWLSGLFGVTVSTVDFDSDADEFVTVKYEQSGTEFDVVSSGAGLQQVIQMLTYLYLSQPRVLLIDEPDAHLHSKLQAQLGELFRRVAQDLDAQVFLSTHSLDLIDTFSTNDVLVVDSSKKMVSSIGHNADLVSTLVDANVVDVSALSRLLSSRRLVVIEDADQTILKAIDKAIGNPLFAAKSSSYVLPARGVGNFRAIAELGRILAGLTGTKFDLLFVQDRDGMPDFIAPFVLQSQQGDGVTAHILDRHEVESYLLEPTLIEAAGALVGRQITQAHARDAVIKAGDNVKAKARRASLETAKLVNRHLASNDRWKDAELEEKVYEWFDALDLKVLDVIQRVCPGKETLAETLKILNDGAPKQLTRGHLVASISIDRVANDICDLLAKLAEAKPNKPVQPPSRAKRPHPKRKPSKAARG